MPFDPLLTYLTVGILRGANGIAANCQRLKGVAASASLRAKAYRDINTRDLVAFRRCRDFSER